MFIPVHGPQPGCSNHHHPQTADWYRFFGIYRTKIFGSIPRFRRKSCRMTFSSRTFSIDYYAKKSLKMRDLYDQVNGGVGIRKIARNLNVHHNTIRNRIAQMTRNVHSVSSVNGWPG
jgi:transposase-like protein